MLMLKARRPAYCTLESWAIGVLLEAGAIEECPHHGHRRCRANPERRAEAFDTARRHPFPGCTPEQSIAAIHDVLGNIGDACPEC
jgi:hypothetical protein